MKHRWTIALLGLCAVAGAAAWLALRPQQVDALRVQAAPLVRTVQFSARVATLSRVDVGSTVTGRVAQVLVQEGADVRQGDVLVRLEQDELRPALAQAQASERQAEATVKAARAEFDRAQELVNRGFISASRLDETRRAQDVAGAQLAAARAATVAAQARLGQTDIRAPAPARVLLRQVEPGQIVQPGKALLTLALAGPTQLKAQVDERFLEQLQTGQPAAVVADAFPGQPFAAKVSALGAAVDAQRGAIEVTLDLAGPAPAFLREDMSLSVEVETARRDSALTLPLAALRGAPAGDRGNVLLAQDGRAQPRDVRLGLRTLEAAEVLEGLADGDTVLLSSKVQAGRRVRARLVPASAAAGTASGAQAGGAASALTNAMGR